MIESELELVLEHLFVEPRQARTVLDFDKAEDIGPHCIDHAPRVDDLDPLDVLANQLEPADPLTPPVWADPRALLGPRHELAAYLVELDAPPALGGFPSQVAVDQREQALFGGSIVRGTLDEARHRGEILEDLSSCSPGLIEHDLGPAEQVLGVVRGEAHRPLQAESVHSPSHRIGVKRAIVRADVSRSKTNLFDHHASSEVRAKPR